MQSKNTTRKTGIPRPDRYSGKRSGTVSMTLRAQVKEARLIRKAAEQKKVSAHEWMLTNLLSLAQKQLGL